MSASVGSEVGRDQSRATLVLACAAILLTAADTYVVVLALPDIMAGVGLTSAELPRAAPIVSMFLLGYIAMLPLLGRLSDRHGRLPVLIGCLVVFALGSVVTAASAGLGGVVTGRFLQGLGGGGLVPVTLALVADAWPAERRGVPLGAVGAVQELGSVVGPLYGAALVAAGGWRLIFWINVVLGVLIAVGMGVVRRRSSAARSSSTDRTAVVLLVLSVAAWLVVLLRPAALRDSVQFGPLLDGLVGDGLVGGLTSPLGVVAFVLTLAFVIQGLRSPGPWLDLRALPRITGESDGVGAGLLAMALGCVVLAFASPDPETQTLNANGVPLLVAAAVGLGLFVWRERVHADPLIPLTRLRPRAAWGSLVVSVLVGAALIAALVDVPIFARTTRYPDSQLRAALVLLRFLVGMPIGALAGGWLLRRLSPRVLTVLGTSVAAVAFACMARWNLTALDGGVGASDGQLLAGGLGIGLAVAPVNEAALRAVSRDLHGLVSALVVVARSTGMLLGLSALTAIGLSRFRSATALLDPPGVLCPDNPLSCPAYTDGLRQALLEQVTSVFAGAAACALLAALVALATFGRSTNPGRKRISAVGSEPRSWF